MITGDGADPFGGFPTSGRTSAPAVGPFPFGAFLAAAWTHRSNPAAEAVVNVTSRGAVALSVTADHVAFIGEERLTDYHSPVGSEPSTVLAELLTGLGGRTFRFDSLPVEAVEAVASALDAVGVRHTTVQDNLTAVLDLPSTFDDWLMALGKKERHEVRRKRRKFETEFGAAVIRTGGPQDLDTFYSMHRRSGGEKGGFMTDEMESFFDELAARAGGSLHVLEADGRPLAAAFGFETDDSYFFYNSALDSTHGSFSPGVVLLSMLIEAQIERGAGVFDFLKGDEEYKFRHGAHRRNLFSVEGKLP